MPCIAPVARWLALSGLDNLQPTNELRWNGRVLEQKWVGSPMAYHKRWVPVRKRLDGEEV